MKSFSQIVREAISLAKAADRARWSSGPDDDSPLISLEDGPGAGRQGGAAVLRMTEEERRLRDFLEAQTPDVVYLLTALTYLGRGDFDAKHFLDHYEEVSETFGGPGLAVRAMLGKMRLPQHLKAGLQKLEAAGMDVDKMLRN
jgi:hypothetical protein